MSSPAPTQAQPQPMNREAFSSIIRQQHAPLCAYARVITRNEAKAEELVQDAFVAAWQNIGKFDVTRDISSWLRGIVRNKWRELCRRNSKEVSLSDEMLLVIEQRISALEADRPEVFDRLTRCRERLPEALAESLVAYYDEHLSTDEAAARLDVNGATLRKRLERARQALRECLKQQASHPH